MKRHAAEGNGLRCFTCGSHILAVKDSRPARNSVRRRRRCVVCRSNFTTFEIMSPTRDDVHRLFEALDFYDAMRPLSPAQRALVMAMIDALSPPEAQPPLITGPPPDAGRLSLDAALVQGEPEEAPRG
jgi:hypothetical protein